VGPRTNVDKNFYPGLAEQCLKMLRWVIRVTKREQEAVIAPSGHGSMLSTGSDND
jgi:hypothetical protein